MVMKYLCLITVLLAAVISCSSETGEKSAQMEDKKMIELVNRNDVQGVVKHLENGADVNAADEEKRSLLLIAANKQYTEMAEILVKNGADVNQQAENLDSPFLYAGATGQTGLVKLFLEHGARFDVYNRYHGTALIPACERGHVETVRLLAYTTGFPVNHVNRLGWTALMEAVVLGDGSDKYRQIVQILKDAGADLSIPDNDGVTALQHAEEKGFSEIVKILK